MMTNLTIQIHATHAELINLISSTIKEFSLHIVYFTSRPFSAHITSLSDLANNSSEDGFGKINEIFISKNLPNINESSRLRFLDVNPNGIIITMGRREGENLTQAVFSTSIVDPEFGRVAKKMRSYIKRRSKAGVLVINEMTGAFIFAKEFRFTEGAFVLEQNGVKMRPFAGDNLIRLRN